MARWSPTSPPCGGTAAIPPWPMWDTPSPMAITWRAPSSTGPIPAPPPSPLLTTRGPLPPARSRSLRQRMCAPRTRKGTLWPAIPTSIWWPSPIPARQRSALRSSAAALLPALIPPPAMRRRAKFPPTACPPTMCMSSAARCSLPPRAPTRCGPIPAPPPLPAGPRTTTSSLCRSLLPM